MKNEFVARALHVASFARAAGHHDGVFALSEFDRLLEVAEATAASEPVHFSVRGELRADGAGMEEPWLHLSANATLQLICQRCLGPAALPVEFEREFRFVANEALAAIEDEESEEDVLVLSKSFDLLELIEDELLMAMPPVPKHDVCPKPVRMHAADADFESTPDETPHPFAALQSLKDKGLG
jgi:uncharacterized protein